ncbi:guanylate-binding protein 1 [Bombina bombina]|uniref:guanylate-binding protein 1 n=1 Tax=Bombina bombina TaxID=8345 RepID=UPI00235AF7E3|nr:guanylate-binding protein 1 [Bombina bombina]XP_053547117.1 guanylate-binding protein 1 [Bombina bombina]XP_053547118.1 guanylate-binding protein 1 [Bombina bombina]
MAMEHPVCLIENNPNGELVVNQDALKILSDITKPVVVIAIVGRYRTGKSYLMNKLAGHRSGFALGSTIQSKTKGIWMWCVPHPSKPEQTLVLLDTEGLGDVEKGNSANDTWIFAVAVLLSSSFVYNSVGTIDQQAMDQLHYVTELSEHIKTNTSLWETMDEEEEIDASAEFKRFFPSFTWCVRDFCLDLEIDGKPITEDQYLCNALKLKSGFSKKVLEYNLPRECIRHYFHSHKCFVFDQPANKQNLQRLDDLPDSELDPTFVMQTEKFLSYVFDNSQPKTMPGGHIVTGRLFGNLTSTYVETIKSGLIPCIENAVQTLSKLENSRAVNDALSKYEEEMSHNINEFPTETEKEFIYVHQKCEKEALKVFMDRSFKDENQEYQIKLISGLEENRIKYYQCNEETSIMKCKFLLQELSEKLEKKIAEGEYSRPGGHKEFMEEKHKLIDTYHQSSGKGIKALEVLQEFLKEKEDVEAVILRADQTMTDAERRKAEEHAKAEAAARENEIKERNLKCLEQIREDQQRCMEQQQEMLKLKLEEERKKTIEQNEWLIAQKLKEKQDLLAKGFERQREMLENQIRHLQKINEEAKKKSFLGELLSPITAFFSHIFGSSSRSNEHFK